MSVHTILSNWPHVWGYKDSFAKKLLQAKNPKTIKRKDARKTRSRTCVLDSLHRAPRFLCPDRLRLDSMKIKVQGMYTAQCSRCSESTSRKHHESPLRLPKGLHLLSFMWMHRLSVELSLLIVRNSFCALLIVVDQNRHSSRIFRLFC